MTNTDYSCRHRTGVLVGCSSKSFQCFPLQLFWPRHRWRPLWVTFIVRSLMSVWCVLACRDEGTRSAKILINFRVLELMSAALFTQLMVWFMLYRKWVSLRSFSKSDLYLYECKKKKKSQRCIHLEGFLQKPLIIQELSTSFLCHGLQAHTADLRHPCLST